MIMLTPSRVLLINKFAYLSRKAMGHDNLERTPKRRTELSDEVA